MLALNSMPCGAETCQGARTLLLDPHILQEVFSAQIVAAHMLGEVRSSKAAIREAAIHLETLATVCRAGLKHERANSNVGETLDIAHDAELHGKSLRDISGKRRIPRSSVGRRVNQGWSYLVGAGSNTMLQSAEASVADHVSICAHAEDSRIAEAEELEDNFRIVRHRLIQTCQFRRFASSRPISLFCRTIDQPQLWEDQHNHMATNPQHAVWQSVMREVPVDRRVSVCRLLAEQLSLRG